MTPYNKLYEAARNYLKPKNTFEEDDAAYDALQQAVIAYEQEQPEAIAGEKTIDEIIGYVRREVHGYEDQEFLEDDVEKAMQLYASQQTSAKDKEIAELKQRISVIKEKLPDNKIRELNPIWVRDEIISELEKLI